MVACRGRSLSILYLSNNDCVHNKMGKNNITDCLNL
jgi:hypothetical protein